MRESTLWTWHILAGAVIVVLLGMHMFIMHLDAILAALGLGQRNPIESALVFERSKQAFFMITYILLLGAALYHGLYGFRTILLELSLSAAVEKTIKWIFIIVGLAFFALGTYAAIAVFVSPFPHN